MDKINLIGLAGKIGSGKDYVAEHVIMPLDFYQWAFAWPLKVAVLAENPEYTWEEVFVTKPEQVRTRLQLRGTEEGRMKYGEDVWVRATDAYIRLIHEQWGINNFVITDVRFPNEVDYIKDQDGLVIKIESPVRQRLAQSELTQNQIMHASEIALDDYDNWDIVYNNDFKSARLPSDHENAEKILAMALMDWLNIGPTEIRQRLELMGV